MDCCGTRMRLKSIGQAVIVGEQVYSADRFRCEECGEYRFGAFGAEPIRLLSEWGADWIMQPVPEHETQEEAGEAMAGLEFRRALLR